MQSIHIRVSTEVRDRLHAMAAKRGQAVIDLIRQYIADGLNRMEKESKR